MCIGVVTWCSAVTSFTVAESVRARAGSVIVIARGGGQSSNGISTAFCASIEHKAFLQQYTAFTCKRVSLESGIPLLWQSEMGHRASHAGHSLTLGSPI